MNIRHTIAKWRFARAFRATLPAARAAVEKAERNHERLDGAAIQAQRDALHRALAHGRGRRA